MAKNPRGIGSIGDDLAKLIAKVIQNQAPAKVRAVVSQAANKGVTSKPTSKLTSKPKTSKPSVSKNLKQVATKITKNDATKTTKGGRELSRIGNRAIKLGKSPFPKTMPKPIPKATRPITSKPAAPKGVGKIAAVTPERPKRGVSLLDKSGLTNKPRGLAKSAAEQREADRRANRALKQTGDNPKPESRPKGNNKNVDVKGSVITPPSKATMRPAKPSKGSYEADKAKVEKKADAADIGRGQSRPKPKGEEASMTSREREQARKNRDTERRESAKQGPSVEAKMLRLEVYRAKTPAEKAVAQKNLTNFLLKKKK